MVADAVDCCCRSRGPKSLRASEVYGLRHS